MSCKDCQASQRDEVAYFFRWKNANIEIRACDQHVREVFEALMAWAHERKTKVGDP